MSFDPITGDQQGKIRLIQYRGSLVIIYPANNVFLYVNDESSDTVFPGRHFKKIKQNWHILDIICRRSSSR